MHASGVATPAGGTCGAMAEPILEEEKESPHPPEVRLCSEGVTKGIRKREDRNVRFYVTGESRRTSCLHGPEAHPPIRRDIAQVLIDGDV